jgi:hypothetical protein
MILERLLAIRVCLDYTKQHEKIFDASTPRRSRPHAGGDLCPRLLEGAGKGRLLDPRAIEAAQRLCRFKGLHGGAVICRRRNRQADRAYGFRGDGTLSQGASVRPRHASRED